MLLDLFVVDYPNIKNRFEVNYCLLSLNFNSRILIKVFEKKRGVVPTMTHLWSSAMWLEREAWDLFGVFFLNNVDLRRILTDYGFLGHPGRKDFPITGFNEVRYDDTIKHIVSEPLELAQEMRLFDFTNPWYTNIELKG
jgi:NADH:ubiquinone oxidoreductase subunit C